MIVGQNSCTILDKMNITDGSLSLFYIVGIMTAKLLPAFLECFNDEYLSIRSECCITAGNLAIKDESVIDKLVHLATFDTIWKVKALAMQGNSHSHLLNY